MALKNREAIQSQLRAATEAAEELGAAQESEWVADWLRAGAPGARSYALADLADAIDVREYRHHKLSK